MISETTPLPRAPGSPKNKLKNQNTLNSNVDSIEKKKRIEKSMGLIGVVDSKVDLKKILLDEVAQKRKDEEEDIKREKKRGDIRLQVFMFILMLILVILFMYIIRPFSIIVSLYYLYNIALLDPLSNRAGSKKYYSYPDMDLKTRPETIHIPFYFLGIFILFGMPLVYLFSPGIEIISIQTTKWQKFIVFFLILLEATLEIPLTFLYESNMYSLFLYEEEGIEKLLAPWIIFYPTNHILSFWEIFKNLLDGILFLLMGLLKREGFNDDPYNFSDQDVIMIMLFFNALKVIFYCIFFFLRMKREVRKCNKENNQDKDNEPKTKTKNKGEKNEEEIEMRKRL